MPPSGVRRRAPKEHRLSERICIVCGHDHWRDHLDLLLQCERCGFVTARVDASLDARSLYEGDYFTGEEYLDYLADEAFFRKNFEKRLKRVRARCPGGRLLEIGAAYGFFLDCARPSFEGVGFEVNPAAVDHARGKLGLDVRSADFLSTDLASLGGPFDAAVMWDVIEHLERPDLLKTVRWESLVQNADCE
jgi:cyclopropane fatty-acyl-phospholipid synthase-like methyltransferase